MKTTAHILPMSREEMDGLGWDALDVLIITGDAYFDHPSHGAAVIGRVLLDAGYKVGVIARPDWKTPNDLKIMGAPHLFVGITAGAVDSTLNNYTADLAPRSNDQYAPKGDKYGRPNYASAVYAGTAKAAFPGIPIILGGIEASTRRFAYYDYLKKSIRRSVLVDTRADLLVFGPGESQVITIADRLSRNKDLKGISGTARLQREKPPPDYECLPHHDAVKADTTALLQQTNRLEQGMGPHSTTGFAQQYQEGYVVCEPPSETDPAALDRIHALPFSRKAHPSYREPIPALETVRWSVIAQRGCPGGCSFCAISYHQGRQVVSRSDQSILAEIIQLTEDPQFKGTITDVGGPTANCFGISIKDPEKCRRCKRPSCLHPGICNNLETNQSRYVNLLKKANRLPGVKHLFVASGIRHDLALLAPEFIRVLAGHHTGGHLKVAPEHSDNNVLKLMRKPPIEQMEKFELLFKKSSKEAGKDQYLVPYFIAGFPGATKAAGNHAGDWLKNRNQSLEQVQNFIPLPGTMAAAMYAAGKDPKGKDLYIPAPKERKRQKEILLGKRRISPARTRTKRSQTR